MCMSVCLHVHKLRVFFFFIISTGRLAVLFCVCLSVYIESSAGGWPKHLSAGGETDLCPLATLRQSQFHFACLQLHMRAPGQFPPIAHSRASPSDQIAIINMERCVGGVGVGARPWHWCLTQ